MRIITLLLVLLLPSLALAAPTVTSVTGNVGHGQKITITGSGFGTKSSGAPLVWDNFEQGTLGQTITSSGLWASERDGSSTVFSNSYLRHTLSKINAKHTVSSTNDEFSKMFTQLNANGSKLFVSYWLRVDFVSGWDATVDQLKVMRLVSNNAYNNPPYMLWQSFSSDNTTMRTSYITAKRSDAAYLGGGLGNGSSVNGGMPKLTEHQWVNVQISWHNSTSPTTVKFLVAPGGGPYQGVSYNNLATLTSTSGPYLNTVKLGYHQNGGPLAYNQWDDIYIDNSWARVEIGDQPVYDNCTRREMQIPSQWSNDSITLNVNQGAFKPGTEAYLFAVDANGVPSSGKKIIIGDAITGDTNSPTISQPSAPQNLRIQ